MLPTTLHTIQGRFISKLCNFYLAKNIKSYGEIQVLSGIETHQPT